MPEFLAEVSALPGRCRNRSVEQGRHQGLKFVGSKIGHARLNKVNSKNRGSNMPTIFGILSTPWNHRAMQLSCSGCSIEDQIIGDSFIFYFSTVSAIYGE